MIKKGNLTEQLLMNVNRYFFSIEEAEGKKWMHLYANIYYDDGIDNFRMDEWKFKFINLTEVGKIFAEGNREQINNILSEWAEDVKYTQSDNWEKVISFCAEFFNGCPGEKADIQKICELPVGNYYFDWECPFDGIRISREYILQNVYIGLQKVSGDEELVTKKLDEFDGIESYLYLRTIENDCLLSTKMTRVFLEVNDIKEDDLWKQAELNDETVIINLEEFVFKTSGREYREEYLLPMYIITNNDWHKGASSILNKNALKEFCKAFNTNQVIVFPASIHEMILMPKVCGDEVDIDSLHQMVKEINHIVVDSNEQLTDRAYILTISSN